MNPFRHTKQRVVTMSLRFRRKTKEFVFFIIKAAKQKCQVCRVMLKVEMINPKILEIKPNRS